MNWRANKPFKIDALGGTGVSGHDRGYLVNTSMIRRHLITVAFALLLIPYAANADDIAFPPGANVFNVVTDGGLDNTGQTDCTEALNEILSEKFGKKVQVVYFPKGTYLVSGMVRGRHIGTLRGNQHYSAGPIVIGESRTETIIRLKDGTWPEDRLEPGELPKRIDERVVWHTGDANNTTFYQIIQNLTINTGRNNAGATGMVYIASNNGHLSGIDIVSDDGQGAIGLALTGVENGPALIRDVRIDGFRRGLHNHGFNYMTVVDLVIQNAGDVGVTNDGLLAMENLSVTMQGSAPAVRNLKNSWLCLIGGAFDGRGSAAIHNTGKLYARAITAKGFSAAIEATGTDTDRTPPNGPVVEEYASQEPVGLFQANGGSLGLPVKQAPYPAWDRNFEKWVNLEELRQGQSWDQAWKQALDQEDKTTLVIPFSETDRVQLKSKVTVGGAYSRIVGTSARFAPEPHNRSKDAALIIGDGTAPVVLLQNMLAAPTIIIRTDRTVILDTVFPQRYESSVVVEGAGDVFLINSGCRLVVNNPEARVWARHYNHEAKELALDVQAGSVWVLGFKSENLHQRAEVGPKGRLEILGLNSYEVGRDKAHGPLVDVNDGRFSLVGLVQQGTAKHSQLVRETQRGVTRIFTVNGNPTGHNFLLFTNAGPE